MIIGVWGDSVAYGSLDSEGLGWPGRLRKVLPTDDYNHLYNLARCGDRTSRVLERFPLEIDHFKPTTIIIAYGINDAKIDRATNANMVPADMFKANVNELLHQARKRTENVYWIGPTRVGGEHVTENYIFRDSESLRYRDIVSETCSDNDVGFIDVFDTLDPEIDLADGLHANANGYQKLYDVIENNLNLI